MPKSPAERKAAQRARQAASGSKKLELTLDHQELEMLSQNCAARRPGREPYDLSEYLTILIRKDNAELQKIISALGNRECGRCGDQLPVKQCPCKGEAACWVNSGWHELKLEIPVVTRHD
ncbi:hypothetical protein LU196_13000 [Pantoea sp. Mb-10]|uniref:hypothetical protein n=1 Tax=unclassified Pantoea TaxID=2630326 RepID=UPI001E648C26|nr:MULTISPECIES: hypothetical protein [unclassified Pantoea]MCE0490957.1 hypothetical protein [Pantoea sp. Mb-10]MCE0499885.1 hypothetical protein [Pantoea sp. Pb-8]